MRTGTLRILAGLGVVTLLAAGSVQAQELLPPATRKAGPPPAPILDYELDHDLEHKEPLHPHDKHDEECGPGGFFVTGEYLLLKPRRRALDFAIIDPIDNGVPEGIIESLDWATRSGFRAGAGYRLPGEPWEIGVLYTYLHSDDNRALAAPAGGILYASLTRPGTIEEVTNALALTSLDYNVLDAEVGRRFRVGESLTVRLFGGGRAAWIDQIGNAFYNGRDANRAHVLSQVHFDGAGLRLGAEGHMAIAHGFSLFGRGSGALLVGDLRSRLFQANDAGATIQTNLFEKFDNVVPVAELAVGLGWECKHLRLRAGYEITNWFNLADLPDLTDDFHAGKATRRLSDLSLEGLFVELGLLF